MLARLLALLKGLPAQAYIGAGAIALISTWLMVNNAHQRAIGAERILRHSADSIAAVRKQSSDSALKVAALALQARDVLAAKAAAEAAKDAATQARTNEALRATASERDAARRLLEDSLATVAQLRSTVGRLVSASVADSIAYAAERMQSAKTKASLLATIAGDTVALRTAQGAIVAALNRATAAEAARKLEKAPRGGLLGRCGAIAGYGGVWAQGAFKAGPAVTLGCRFAP